MRSILKQEPLAFIKEAGWVKGRKIDIHHYLEVLVEEEYDVFQAATDFLGEYGEQLEVVLVEE